MKNQLETCKNCEQTFEIDFKFCPHCGQQTNDELTVGVLFYNTISNYFSFDARFFKSFLPLLFRPGYLAKSFIEGKRLLYLHPAQLYLFVSVVFFFLLSTLVVRNQVQDLDTNLQKTLKKPLISDSTRDNVQQVLDSVKLDSVLYSLKDQGIIDIENDDAKTIDSIIQTKTNKSDPQLTFDFNERKVDSLIAINAPDAEVYSAMGMGEDVGSIKRKFYEQSLKFYKKRNGGQILQAAYDTIPISLFILLPIFALILKTLCYRRRSYSHHLVFSFYFFSFLFTVFSLILIVNYFMDIPDWIDWLLVLSTFFYLLFAVKKFYVQGWFLSIFKTGLATSVYFMFVIPIAIVIISLVGFFSY